MAREKQVFPRLDETGAEILDPTPIAIPLGMERPETMAEMIRRLAPDIIQRMTGQEAETFEESEDFDVNDDFFDPTSPYEEVFDPVLGRSITYDEFKKNEAIYKERYAQADANAEEAAYQAFVHSQALRARYKAEFGGDPPEEGREGGSPPRMPAEGGNEA
jgi:hypothetical protein